jgi:dTDP-4-amino-4,6-dideoxygalactose transaminase
LKRTNNKIGFNIPHLTGKETHYIYEAVAQKKISGNGKYTQLCQEFLEGKFNFQKSLLTSSCTDALEMSALLLNIETGDEVIMPSYTFVSTANAFVLRGAKIVFVDSRKDYPGMDEDLIESLITSRTKVIVPVHYAGVACDMDKIMAIAIKHNLWVVEDAAQAIDSYYKGQSLGSIGHLGTFSFHETKNIISGEGGMLVVNHDKFIERSEIIWEKGTNRSAFWRGEVDKYGWVDIGSSFLPSELTAAFLWAQLEHLEQIQNKRRLIWERYNEGLASLVNHGVQLPHVPEYATNNGHMFYFICESIEQRTSLIEYLKQRNIYAVFHYLSLHKSPYFTDKHDGRSLNESDRYSNCLLRLPFFYNLNLEQQNRVISSILDFFNSQE